MFRSLFKQIWPYIDYDHDVISVRWCNKDVSTGDKNEHPLFSL